MAARAHKQWSLTKTESFTSFESWHQNLQYTLSLDPVFSPYLQPGVTWAVNSAGSPTVGSKTPPSLCRLRSASLQRSVQPSWS